MTGRRLRRLQDGPDGPSGRSRRELQDGAARLQESATPVARMQRSEIRGTNGAICTRNPLVAPPKPGLAAGSPWGQGSYTARDTGELFLKAHSAVLKLA